MFGVKEDNTAATSRELNTIIGKGSFIDGKINIKHSLRVDGKVKGEISSTGTVTVGSDGEIDGTVNALNVIIGGKVKGKMNIKGKIILEKNSVLIGDIKTEKLTISEGAVFDGNCIMNGNSEADQKQSEHSDKKDRK